MERGCWLSQDEYSPKFPCPLPYSKLIPLKKRLDRDRPSNPSLGFGVSIFRTPFFTIFCSCCFEIELCLICVVSGCPNQESCPPKFKSCSCCCFRITSKLLVRWKTWVLKLKPQLRSTWRVWSGRTERCFHDVSAKHRLLYVFWETRWCWASLVQENRGFRLQGVCSLVDMRWNCIARARQNRSRVCFLSAQYLYNCFWNIWYV